jgi:hypothetical protein
MSVVSAAPDIDTTSSPQRHRKVGRHCAEHPAKAVNRFAAQWIGTGQRLGHDIARLERGLGGKSPARIREARIGAANVSQQTRPSI